MAEAIARHEYGSLMEVESAGISPLGHITEETLTVLEEIGVPTGSLRSKGFEEIALEDVQIVVNLCGHSLTRLLPPAFKGEIVERKVSDPYGRGLDVYRRARDAIHTVVTEELRRRLGIPKPFSLFQ
jgi:protein-tyrosine-phosphatase